ncbi:(2Fe-2S)-binding protein [Limoniibacter endophyticus]|uniref:NAD(FAD)-dependent dehydrogenase n=1 Tax=Limoniibacter endophyticus TaxID=1565040 RepID=A0A8J3DJ65_9HYPH|nr:(2Fe-2S)-binding protein [Limoniibacter endophyticus]GHC72623.1 NAD(FAD)-dependent dehydrogenase [Limoniibacter endophyticus]
MTITPAPLFHRLCPRQPDTIIRFDGREIEAISGESLITALLGAGLTTGRSEFDHKPRAGFCLMGACQDCTVWTRDGRRLRACTVEVVPGLDLCSLPKQEITLT